MIKPLLGCICLIVALTAAVAAGRDKPIVEFQDGERIILLGNEFFERDLDRGYIETELTTRFPEKNLTFRNLGYSGDTVWADARNLCAGWENFGPADQGFNRLKGLVDHLKPTLIFVAYGMNESFDGPAGLEHFVQGLNRMLDMLAQTEARIVLIGPIRHEDLGRPLPDPSQHNQELRLYINAMQKVARERGCPFIDLFDALGDGTKANPRGAYTSDGIHLNAYGYWRVAQVLEQAMGYPPRTWEIQLHQVVKEPPQAEGTTLNSFQMGGGLGRDFGMRFTATDAMLPIAPPPPGSPKAIIAGDFFFPGQQRVLRFKIQSGRRYALKCDGRLLVSATADEWAKGVQLNAGPDFDQEEQLRKMILAKNFDFFAFWRPDNDTYIFGYRQHEQGRNAVEIPKFEPLAIEKDSQIDKLRLPTRHTYVITVDESK